MTRRAHGTPGRVRIGAGTLRGSVLAVPERPGLRPTPARIRETLFNWLQAWVPGSRCLDAFAGSGALGIEALSRGAAAACFVERDAGLAAALRANLARLGAAGEVVHADALQWLRGTAPAAFDVVFLDPPFDADDWQEAMQRLEQGGWLAPQAFIHVEMPAARTLSAPPAWQVHRQGRAGDVAHVLYRRSGA